MLQTPPRSHTSGDFDGDDGHGRPHSLTPSLMASKTSRYLCWMQDRETFQQAARRNALQERFEPCPEYPQAVPGPTANIQLTPSKCGKPPTLKVQSQFFTFTYICKTTAIPACEVNHILFRPCDLLFFRWKCQALYRGPRAHGTISASTCLCAPSMLGGAVWCSAIATDKIASSAGTSFLNSGKRNSL